MRIVFSLLIGLILLSCNVDTKVQFATNTKDASYDSLKASEYEADAYGMKSYVMAFLKEGPNRDQDSLTAAKLQADHLANITRMAEEGTLVVAGPFLDNQPIKGIYIFNVTTIEEAETLTNSDPAVKAGRLVMELHPWYSSAALIEVNEIHKTLSKKEITE